MTFSLFLFLAVVVPSSQDRNFSFAVTYEDIENATGSGFDDPQSGASRRQTVAEVLVYLADLLGEIGQVEILVRSVVDSDPGALPAETRPYFDEVPGFAAGHPFAHLVTLIDPCRPDNCGEDRADMEMTVNFGKAFHVRDGPPPDGSYDLFSVLLGRLYQGLGTYSLTSATGSSTAEAGTFTPFDALLQTGDGNPLRAADGSLAVDLSALTGAQGGIRFAGQRAALALGRFPEVLAGDVFQEGLSLAHWDPQVGDAVLVHPFPTGTARRQLALFEIAALTDLGYRVEESSTLVFPWVSNSGDFTSTLVLNNPRAGETRVALTAARADGVRFSAQRTLPGNGFLQVEVETLFPDMGLGTGTTVIATADSADLRGRWITSDRPSRVPSQGIAVALPNDNSESLRVGKIINYGFLPANADFISAPVLINVGSQATEVDLYRFNEDGSLKDHTLIGDIEPFVPVVLLVTQADQGNAYAIAQARDQPVTGVVFVFNDRGQTAIGNVTRLSEFTPPNQP